MTELVSTPTRPCHSDQRNTTLPQPASTAAGAPDQRRHPRRADGSPSTTGAKAPVSAARRLTAILRCLSRRPRLVALACALLTMGALAPGAAAATPAPGFSLTSIGQPTNFSALDPSTCANPNDQTVACDSYTLTATNIGTQATDGSDITLTDTLPAGLSAQSVEFHWSVFNSVDFNAFFHVCSGTTTITCTLPAFFQSAIGQTVQPGQQLVMVIHLTVDPGASGQATNAASISGGGAPTAQTSSENTLNGAPAPPGIQQVQASLTGIDGQPAAQAGGHPYEFTTSLVFNTELGQAAGTGSPVPVPVEDPKDVSVDLPPGLLGDPQAAPQCPLSTFAAQQPCPVDSQVGTVALQENTIGHGGSMPLYNLSAAPGAAAELGFLSPNNDPIVLTGGVRTGDDYGLRVIGSGIPEAGIGWVTVTIWGSPPDPSHDAQRGQVCGWSSQWPVIYGGCSGGGVSSGGPPTPFLTSPTDCAASAPSVGFSSDTWQHSGIYDTARAPLPAVTGCDALSFNPALSVAPDNSQAGAPAGLSVDLKVPQTSDPGQLATPELRDATVTLPVGMTMNPSGAGGLGSCSDAQFAVDSPDAATCPDSSKIGTVQLHTPLLDHSLPGNVYVGAPQCSPCSPADAVSGKMVRLFLQINDPVSGVIVKLPGTVSIDQSTGQLTATFLQNPQLPFDELRLSFKDGPRAPLVNPATCGLFTTTSDLAPWSAPFSGPDANPSSTFAVSSGCDLGKSFAPTFTAGSTHRQAGAYSDFVLSFTRTDADQQFKGLSVNLPPGLVAKTAGVPLCSDADAAKGTCPAGSQVGTVETGAGAGSEPLFLPGKAYLTGPYKGAPYGLAVVVPAIAGPYNLGTVVVRQALNIDPTTAQVTAVSDAFPTELDGIPLRLRRVDVNLNRPGFIVNPTSCDPMSISGTLTSTDGMTADVGNRFQVGGCASLGFSPKLSMKLTGRGRTRSGDHPNLVSVLTQRGGQANIHNVRVALPLSMALDPNNSQHVCSYQVAQAVTTGPANCPASTLVGHATAITPLLSRPLSGPVYLVQGIRYSHGTAIHTLPSLLIPLRGQIALDLRAQSSVSHGKLVTTFPVIPDAPVSKFTLTINGGRKGILVITGRGRSICGSPQVTQANLIAQNGKAEYPNIKMGTPCRAHHAKHHSRRHNRRRTAGTGRSTSLTPGAARASPAGPTYRSAPLERL